MHDPILEEICRSNPAALRPEVFKRWQQYARDVIDPALARLAEIDAEKATRRVPKKGEAAA